MGNKVISLCDSKYFGFGKLFIATRHKVKADFVVYGPDLTAKQIKTLSNHGISYKQIPEETFQTKMQYLKFELLSNTLNESGRGGATFVDFDTMFLRDWGAVFKSKFDLGVTANNAQLKKKKVLRAYANGGVIFASNSPSAIKLCKYALSVMTKGQDELLPEYDRIFLTLELNRPVNKTWKRTNLRWWVDQVFLSALIVRQGGKPIKDKRFFEFNGFTIGMFNCDKYNVLEPTPKSYKRLVAKGCHILHLKNNSRKIIRAFSRFV